MSEADANRGVRAVRVERQRAWNRFLLTALALHVPLFIYPVLRLGAWLEAPWLLTLFVLLPLASSQIVARMYLRGRRDLPAETWRMAADFWLGLSPILLLTLLVFEVLVAAGLVRPFDAALSTLTITALLGAAGFVVAATPMVKTIHLSSPKLTGPVRFVQITDVHIGSRRRRFLERIVFRINLLEPDFVCITGDFIDQPGVPESSLISLRSILCPIYFSTGNHERYEDLDDILPRLERLGVNVLRSRSLDFSDAVQVIGIDDMDDAEQVGRELAGIDVDTDKYVVLLYHRPRGLEAASGHGVDLMLSGHTHNGQIFPFNLVVGRVFERIVGMYEHEGTRLYVSQGTGTWEPVLRLGTRAEITEFIISPEPKSEPQQEGEA
ncbi:MAG: metallophosphoesterase [Gammaproteobacteria bacterium]|nr:metallophosphoesterase [Gammaproteobacteria bacterium]